MSEEEGGAKGVRKGLARERHAAESFPPPREELFFSFHPPSVRFPSPFVVSHFDYACFGNRRIVSFLLEKVSLFVLSFDN